MEQGAAKFNRGLRRTADSASLTSPTEGITVPPEVAGAEMAADYQRRGIP